MQEKHIVVKRYKIKMGKTKKKRTKEQRDGVTRCESPSPRPVKPITNERSKQLISQTLHILKSTLIMFPLYAPQHINLISPSCPQIS